jgi:hypothetical protein
VHSSYKLGYQSVPLGRCRSQTGVALPVCSIVNGVSSGAASGSSAADFSSSCDIHFAAYGWVGGLAVGGDPRLALGAPVGGADLLALFAHFDEGAAAAALLTLASVDPCAVGLGHGVGGAAVAAVGDDAFAAGSARAAVVDVGLHVALRGVDHGFHLALGDGAHAAERINSGGEGDLAFVDVAESGHDALVEEDDSDLVAGMRGGTFTEGGDSAFDAEGVGEDVGAEAGDLRVSCEGARGVELGELNVEDDGLHLAAGDGDAHVAPRHKPLFARAIDVPRAGHEHVGGEDEVARKVDEAPLPLRLDALDGAAYEWGLVVDAGQLGELGFEGGDDAASDGFLEGSGGSVDCVAFRHETSCLLDAMLLVAVHRYKFTGSAEINGNNDFFDPRPDLRPVVPRKHHDCDLPAFKILLVAEVLVRCHKNVEGGILSRMQKLAVLQLIPAHLARCLYVV